MSDGPQQARGGHRDPTAMGSSSNAPASAGKWHTQMLKVFSETKKFLPSQKQSIRQLLKKEKKIKLKKFF